jgi:3-methyladenine DNA glycosylase AlkD
MTLLATLRKELARVADPAKAPAMQAYMKSDMPFHGVPTPLRRQVTKAVFASCAFEDAAAWRAAVLELWREARFREERYAALALTDWKGARGFQDLAALPMYEEMIVSGAWWDYVDEIAQHAIGGLLRDFPAPMKKTLLAWSRCPDMWKRRSSIIGQNAFKGATDLELLYACIEPSLDSKEFFLRKAIGWALRQYAWTDPAEVVRYVSANEARLSGLSKREALKNVGPRAPRPRGRRP